MGSEMGCLGWGKFQGLRKTRQGALWLVLGAVSIAGKFFGASTSFAPSSGMIENLFNPEKGGKRQPEMEGTYQ
jgi:hypothetical protein